jgi:hypothetical protein
MKYIALTLVSLMAIYFVVINHVSLRRWNNLASATAQLPSTVVGVVPALLVLLALTRGRGLMLASIWLWLWLLLQIRQWWVPYLLGPTRWHHDFQWYVTGGYDRTLRFLNPATGRPAPDLQHFVLQLLTISAAIAVTAQSIASASA